MSKKPIERRIAHAPVEVRQNPDGTVGIRGYAAVWDSPAYGEVIKRGAFTRTIEQRDDIRLLVNHDGVPLARTKSGTLTVGEDERGFWFDASSLDVEGSQAARDLVSALQRGDIDQCSFAGYFSDRKGENGIREVFEVKAVDVSVVTYPWYEETSVGLTGSRDADVALLCLRSLTPDQREEVIALVGDADDGRAVTVEVEVDESDIEDVVDTPDPEDMIADEPRGGMSLADARALLASFAA
jgi:HK97 family phage prohead protease